MKTKILAMYLPQYHCIPENNEFWGEGFTDWLTVKKAEPLFTGHDQPRVPLNENYYDLSLEKNVKWQCQLAKEYGIYGFGVYHYWFNNEKNLLTKPAEIILKNKDIDTHFFFAWDNGNWKRSWSNIQGNDWAPLVETEKQKQSGPKILIPYILGEKPDWKNHYNFLRPFFNDARYLKLDNKPIFIIYNYNPKILEMSTYWSELARKDGFDGVRIIYRYQESGRFKRNSVIDESEYQYNYEPIFNGWLDTTLYERIVGKIRILKDGGKRKGLRILDYDKVWNKILKNAENRFCRPNLFHGCFVSYDDTPRRGNNGTLIKGGSPEKFGKYLKKLIDISEQQDKEFIFLTAWNEWGEGAYLEPDTVNGYSYLEVIKSIL